MPTALRTAARPLAAAVLTAALLSACGDDAAAPTAAAAAGVSAPSSFQTVSVDEIAPRVKAGEVLLVDVREQHEWDAGHAPAALHVSLGTVAERLGEITSAADGRPVAFICRSGSRSAQASDVAVAGGLRSVVNVDGGMTAWEQEGLPVSDPVR